MKRYSMIGIIAAFITILSIVLVTDLRAADPLEGFWESVDENSGEVTAWWEFVVTGEGLRGTIIAIPDDPGDAVCDLCADEYKDIPIIGTQWLQLNKRNPDGSWEDGFIIDSKTGKRYRAKAWVEGDGLKLRGYIGFLYRTQTWNRSVDPR